jgi:thioesterase domain-containing protein/acyl carrier protein
VHMISMPLTANGKVDRKKLPEPGIIVRTEITAPRTEAEAKLLKVWQQVLEKVDIGMEDNFFEIGGHSLKAMQIVSRMNLEMKVDISIREIFNYPTIEKLAAVAEGNTAAKSLLIALNKHREGNINAFFIPPILGFSTIYRSLASRLEGKVNCYGLQYRGSDGSGPYDTSIEAMAHSFLEEILNADSNSEIIITGYSMGALIAFELTKLLEQRDYRVKLVLLDKNVKALENQLSGQSSEESLENYFESEMKPWINFIDKKDIHHFRHFFRHNLSLSNKYVLNGTVSADILAVEARHGLIRTGMEHWKDLTSGNLHHVYADGTHADMLKEENLTGILDYINLTVRQIPVA